MKIKCECGELVAEGEINLRENKVGVQKKKFDMNFYRGTIVKNNSNNPKDWEGICSKCQSGSDKIK